MITRVGLSMLAMGATRVGLSMLAMGATFPGPLVTPSRLSNELSHVYQLSGFADSVYAEVHVLGVLMIRICSMIFCSGTILLLEIETTER